MNELLAFGISSVLSLFSSWVESLIKQGISKAVCSRRISATFSESISKAEKLLKYEEDGFAFSQWLRGDFCQLAKQSIEKNDENFLLSMDGLIAQKAVECGLDKETSAAVSAIFVQDFTAFIKKNNPDLYDWMANKGFFLELNRKLDVAISLEASILANLSVLTKKERCYCTPEDWFRKIRQHTKNPSLDFEYFTVDDNSFIDLLAASLNQDEVSIQYYCMEEAVGCVLNTLRRLDVKKPVLVINNLETWEALREKKANNCILIAAFKTNESVPAIDKNVCVFFIDEERAINMPTIELHRRKLKSLVDYLEDLGASVDRANALIEETNGIYYSLQSKIFNGKPRYYSKKEELLPAIRILLLIPAIYENESFYSQYLEPIFNLPYLSFINAARRLTKGDDPIAIKKSTLRGVAKYELTSIERAWSEFGQEIDSTEYAGYLASLRRLFSKTKWAYGMSFSEDQLLLIFRSIAFYGSLVRPNEQLQIDGFVQGILEDSAKNGSFNDCISNASFFAHASPQGLLNFLQGNKKSIIRNYNSDDYSGAHWISGALLKCLFYPEYAAKALHIAVDYHAGFKTEHKIGPHIEDVISAYFLPWFNISGADAEFILAQAKWALNRSRETVWELLKDVIYENTGPTMSVSLTYRKANENFSVTGQHYRKLLLGYFSLLQNGATALEIVSLLKWSPVMFDKIQLDSFKESIAKGINVREDHELFLLSQAIYDLVHDAREFRRDTYQREESQQFLDDLWDLAERLPYKNGAYRYLRIFFADFHYRLRNPEVYEEGRSFDFDAQRERISNDRKKLWSECIAQGYALDDLLKTFGDVKTERSGYDIVETLHDILPNAFERHAYDSLVAHGYYLDAALYSYGASEAEKTRLVKEANPAELKRLLLRTLPIDPFVLDEVSLLDDKNKYEFWSDYRRDDFSDRDTLLIALHAASEAKAFGTAIRFILQNVRLLSLKEAIWFIFDLSGKDVDSLRQFGNSYETKEFLLANKQEILKNEELLHQSMCIELCYRDLESGDRNTVFLDISLQQNPMLFFLYLSWMFLDDDGNSVNLAKEKIEVNQEKVFSIMFNSHFCPGLIDGAFDADLFAQWINAAEKIAEEKRMHEAFFIGLGKALAYAPSEGELPMPSCVCDYIEKTESDVLDGEIEVSICNRRGIFTDTQGQAEEELAQKYNGIADVLARLGYHRCSSIYRNVSISYHNQSKYYLARAIDEIL